MYRHQHRQPGDIFSEIICKFIVNLPRAERAPERLWFHYQKAYYYYIDHEKNKQTLNSPHEEEKDERLRFFEKLQVLLPPSLRVDPKDTEKWIQIAYKSIPVYGAILLNEKQTRMLCIKCKSTPFGFPKGKIDEAETPITCAIREVWEEVGYDITGKINSNQLVKAENDDKEVTLFVVRGIKSEATQFVVQDETEVDCIEWIPLEAVEKKSVKLNKLSASAFRNLLKLLREEPKTQKSFYELFLENFKLEINKEIEAPLEDPFISFRLDRSKLLDMFR